MTDPIQECDYPALYKAADAASLEAQSAYFNALRIYLFLLIVAAAVAFAFGNLANGALASAALFLLTLGILVCLKVDNEGRAI